MRTSLRSTQICLIPHGKSEQYLSTLSRCHRVFPEDLNRTLPSDVIVIIPFGKARDKHRNKTETCNIDMGQVSLMQLSPIISRQWVQWNMDEVHGIDMQETRKVVENKFPTRD